MSAPDSDAELTIALAEYAHINELRNQIDQKSSARFNFYLALATAVAAVSAGLLSTQPSDTKIVVASASLGVVVLVFGYAIFLRQVAFTAHSARLTAAGNAIRIYLAKRAPELTAYLLLPVGKDRGAFPHRATPFGGFAGAIGILNSAVLAVAAGLYLGRNGFGTWDGIGAGGAFIAALAWHIGYVRRSRSAAVRALAEIAEERGL